MLARPAAKGAAERDTVFAPGAALVMQVVVEPGDPELGAPASPIGSS
ncbi:MAG: hypothetical protein FWJ74_13570 [Gemmatimonadota bacterium]